MTLNLKSIFFPVVLLCGISVVTLAQDDNDYTNNRKNKNKNNDAINTKQQTPVKYIEFIVGKWQVEEISSGGNDTNENNSANQTIEFGRENRYVIYSGNEQVDTGLYRLNEQHGILYLESENRTEPQEWDVAFKDDRMILQRNAGEAAHGQRVRHVYKRIDKASRNPQ